MAWGFQLDKVDKPKLVPGSMNSIHLFVVSRTHGATTMTVIEANLPDAKKESYEMAKRDVVGLNRQNLLDKAWSDAPRLPGDGLCALKVLAFRKWKKLVPEEYWPQWWLYSDEPDQEVLDEAKE